MELHDKKPAQLLRARYMLEDRLASPGSVSGHQQEQMRSGLGGRPPDGARTNVAEVLRAEFGDLLLLMRDLTVIEQKVCRLRYGTVAGVETHEALRRAEDVLEGDGEVVVDAKPKDLDGVPMNGWVRTRGLRSRYPSNFEIGQELGLSARQVQRHLEDARSKIETAKRWRLFADAQESRYT